MSKFNELLESSYSAQLRESNGKVNQTDRNALRNALMEALAADLEAIMTTDGAIVEMQHEEWGRICLEVSIKVKDPEYDPELAQEEYNLKQEAKAAKALEVEKRAAERKAKSDAIAATREAKKATKQVAFFMVWWDWGVGI